MSLQHSHAKVRFLSCRPSCRIDVGTWPSGKALVLKTSEAGEPGCVGSIPAVPAIHNITALSSNG